MTEVISQNRELKHRFELISRDNSDNSRSSKGEVMELRDRLNRAVEEKEQLLDMYLKSKDEIEQLSSESSLKRRKPFKGIADANLD
jgi:hypothetical protein